MVFNGEFRLYRTSARNALTRRKCTAVSVASFPWRVLSMSKKRTVHAVALLTIAARIYWLNRCLIYNLQCVSDFWAVTWKRCNKNETSVTASLHLRYVKLFWTAEWTVNEKDWRVSRVIHSLCQCVSVFDVTLRIQIYCQKIYFFSSYSSPLRKHINVST